MWVFLEKLQRELQITVILTTHYLEEVERLCTDLVILNHGKVVREGQVVKNWSKKKRGRLATSGISLGIVRLQQNNLMQVYAIVL